MDAVTGALVAAAVAWASIWIVVTLPDRPWLSIDGLSMRIAGAGGIALVALGLLGIPLPAWLPLLWMGGGLVIATIIAPRGYAAAA